MAEIYKRNHKNTFFLLSALRKLSDDASKAPSKNRPPLLYRSEQMDIIQKWVELYEQSFSKEDALQDFHADVVDFLNDYKNEPVYKQMEAELLVHLPNSSFKQLMKDQNMETEVMDVVASIAFANILMKDWGDKLNADVRKFDSPNVGEKQMAIMGSAIVTAYRFMRLVKNVDDAMVIRVAKKKQEQTKKRSENENIWY